MKIKSVLLGVLLCCISVFGLLGLTACGEVSVADVKQNFTNLTETLAKYPDVFSTAEFEGISNCDVVVSYGEKVDAKVASEDGYRELKTVYNSILAIARDYIAQNSEFVTNMEDGQLSGESKEALKSVNNSLSGFINAIPNFVRERNILDDYFTKNSSTNTEGTEAYLRTFKRAYGRFVNAGIQLSNDMASFIETTNIFPLLESTSLNAKNFDLVKDYIRAKLLPVYSQFKINKIENNFNFKASDKGTAYARVDTLMNALNSSFEDYKSKFASGRKAIEPAPSTAQTNMKKLFDTTKIFLVEMNDYFRALNGIDFEGLALTHENDWKAYCSVNKDAERYMEKVEQFVGVSTTQGSLGRFINEVSRIVYGN